MKKNIGIIVIFALFTISSHAYAATVGSKSVALGTQIPLRSGFSVTVKNISDNVSAANIAWDTQYVGARWQKAKQYVELTVDCNSVAWSVDIHTNNTGANPSMLQKGGIFSTTSNSSYMPVAWIVSDSLISTINCGEPTEILTNEISCLDPDTEASSTALVNWKYVKDSNDQDDPNTTLWIESWSDSQSKGYARILTGIKDKKVMLPYTEARIQPSKSLLAVSPLYIYFEGCFDYLDGNSDYQGTIYFDLIYQ